MRFGFRFRRTPAPPPCAPTAGAIAATLLRLVTDDGRPNMNALNEAARNIDVLALNVKALGYQLARDLAAALPMPPETAARHVELGGRASTQADLESDWAAHWCRALGVPRVFHRKLWELAYVLQVLYDAGMLTPGTRGLGFGCGSEPLASFFAARGVSSLITDQPADAATAQGWRDTHQHAAGLDQAYHPHLVDRAAFDAHAGFRAVDMTRIPAELAGFDFCWSICALEHLGSIEAGLAFVEASLATLRPGGVAVHTTELNINPLGPTVDNWPTVLFQRHHLEALAERLRAQGHVVAPLTFDFGDRPLDRFIDMPPWHDGVWEHLSRDLGQPLHLKVAADGFVATCYGLHVVRG